MLYYVDDDYGIGLALSGRQPDSQYCLFINAVLARFVSALSVFGPGLNWFWLTERFLSLFGLTVLIFLCMELVKIKPLLPPAAMVACLGLIPFCTFNTNFTGVAGFCSLVGMLIVILDFDDTLRYLTYRRSMVGIGIFFCLMGFCIRYECFLLMLPFAFVLLCIISWDHKRLLGAAVRQRDFHVLFQRFFNVGMVVVLCFAASVYDASVWSQGDWAQWKQYNHYRSVISDYPAHTYDEVSSQLQAIGVSENDLLMMKTFMTADTNVFSLDTMKQTAQIVHKQTPPPHTQTDTIPFPNPDNVAAFTLTLVLFGYVLLASRRRLVCLFIIAMTYGIYLVLFFGGRLPDRVLWCFIGYAIISLAIIGDFRELRLFRNPMDNRTVLSAMSLGSASILLLWLFIPNVISFYPQSIGSTFDQSGQAYTDKPGLAKYVDNGSDDMYIYSTLGGYLWYEKDFQQKNIPSTYLLRHNFSTGGWMVDSPSWNAINKEMGIENPLVALVQRDNTYVITQDSTVADTLQVFFAEHYGLNVHPERVDAPFSVMLVYKFVPDDQQTDVDDIEQEEDERENEIVSEGPGKAPQKNTKDGEDFQF